MTSDRYSKLFPTRKVERDSDCLTYKGELGEGEYIGIADRNAGIHLKLEEEKPGNFKKVVSNFKGKITPLFIPDEIEERDLFQGEFAIGKIFTSELFKQEVKKSNLDKGSTMLFYGKRLINLKLLKDSEKAILVSKYPYYKSIFPDVSDGSSGSQSSRGKSSSTSKNNSTNSNKGTDSIPNNLDRDILLQKLNEEFTEGNPIETVVKSKKRNTRLVKLIKDLALADDGILRCACCKFEMQTAFGFEYIEAAHRIPLSERPEGYEIDPHKDLFLLCPNCHVAYDRLDHVSSVEELKAAMKVEFMWVKKDE